ncbi:MAG TPA: DUF3667 domain-containing protein [Ideonella sp.]|uniref:DUF3667 domain-containing protein n=1 Tax=Ideonella sp. TaxID=1929293 RepID=UPI002E2F54F0|nr:DUF3667 domain-containing protein [Ideonella sp.]HEX5687802.1 DUF3667 domain-containing protein [Ideonella sp.]
MDNTLPVVNPPASPAPQPAAASVAELAPVAETAVTVVVAAAEACRNCGTALPDPKPNYCGHCGQETHLKPPTLLEFAQQFGGSYISMEGALWRTLLLLLFLPGRLTREYLNGRKRRYVLPLRLYLTISVITLLSVQWFGSFGPTDGKDFVRFDGSDEMNSTRLEITDAIKAGMEDGKFVCRGLPASWCERLQERFSLDAKGMERELRKVPGRFVSHWGSAMFALLPLYAFFLKLLYINRRMRWSEHLVFALHLHAFIFAMVLVQLTGVPVLATVALVAIPVYSVIALQVVYGGRWWATTLRVMTLGLFYFIALTTLMAFVAVWAFVA